MTIASIKTHRGEGRSPRASDDGKGEDYSRESAIDIVRGRAGWLVTFCAGLVLAAFIVDEFEDVLARHVQLSFFVPLIMGHGGNTGSQSVSMIIRALALKQVTQRDLFRCVLKESIAGALMGGIIGVAVLCFSFMWSHLSPGVGLAVCIALPIISLFANGFGAFLTIMADRFNMDPAVTSVPLMTTIVDTTGLIIYFYIAECIMDTDLHAAEHGAAAGLIAAKTAGALAKSGLVKTGGHGAAKAAGKVVSTGGRLLMQLMNGR